MFRKIVFTLFMMILITPALADSTVQVERGEYYETSVKEVEFVFVTNAEGKVCQLHTGYFPLPRPGYVFASFKPYQFDKPLKRISVCIPSLSLRAVELANTIEGGSGHPQANSGDIGNGERVFPAQFSDATEVEIFKSDEIEVEVVFSPESGEIEI